MAFFELILPRHAAWAVYKLSKEVRKVHMRNRRFGADPGFTPIDIRTELVAKESVRWWWEVRVFGWWGVARGGGGFELLRVSGGECVVERTFFWILWRGEVTRSTRYAFCWGWGGVTSYMNFWIVEQEASEAAFPLATAHALRAPLQGWAPRITKGDDYLTVIRIAKKLEEYDQTGTRTVRNEILRKS